MVGRFLPTDST
jgi:transposase, IS6 family